MVTLARRLERTKGVVGTLLAGLLLLCAADAPRSHADANDWRAKDAASPPLAITAGIRAKDPETRASRPVTRASLFVPTRAFTVDSAAPASSLHATLVRVDGPNAVAARGYDATAPPALL